MTEQEAQKEQDFATMILDNLKKAGVQNTRKEERLNFDRLTLMPERGCTRRVNTPSQGKLGAWPSPSVPNTALSARSR